MKLAGKAPPDEDEIRGLADAGFDRFELYLSTDILTDRTADEIVETCRRTPLEVANVHTPHVDPDDNASEYYRQSDLIASTLDATLVLDSNPLSTRYMPDVYPSQEVDAPRHGYENDPSVSAYYLRVNHLAEGHPLVLDTAHLHMSEPSYHGFIAEALELYGSDRIPVVHLDTATATEDGHRPLRGGEVDMPAIVDLLVRHDYDGTVVLEVPADHQPDALDYVESLLSDAE